MIDSSDKRFPMPTTGDLLPLPTGRVLTPVEEALYVYAHTYGDRFSYQLPERAIGDNRTTYHSRVVPDNERHNVPVLVDVWSIESTTEE